MSASSLTDYTYMVHPVRHWPFQIDPIVSGHLYILHDYTITTVHIIQKMNALGKIKEWTTPLNYAECM